MDDIAASPEVADDWREQVQAKAAAAGLSVVDYLLRERKLEELPTMREFLQRLKNDPPVVLSESPAEIIRRARDAD